MPGGPAARPPPRQPQSVAKKVRTPLSDPLEPRPKPQIPVGNYLPASAYLPLLQHPHHTCDEVRSPLSSNDRVPMTVSTDRCAEPPR